MVHLPEQVTTNADIVTESQSPDKWNSAVLGGGDITHKFLVSLNTWQSKLTMTTHLSAKVTTNADKVT